MVLAALAGNLAIAVTKFAAWAISGSTALLTEAIHSVVDTGDQVLLLIGQGRAARAPDASHPFGYGLETYFWTFIVALMIFLAGGAVAVWEGAEKLLHPEPIARPLLAFAVLAASAVFEGLSFRTAYREFRQIVGGRDVPLMAFLRASKDPNVFATLLEDGGALTGLALAGLGVAGSALAGWTWADGAASVLIGLLLIGIAGFLANETRSLIAGEAAAPVIVERVRQALGRAAHLGEPLRVRTLHLGPQAIVVTICWRFSGEPGYAALQTGFAEITADVRAADPRVVDVLFEFTRPAGRGDGVSSAPRSWEGGSARPDPRARLP